MEIEIRRVKLRELIEAMKSLRDDEPFRWYQASYVSSDGSVQAGETLMVTMGDAREILK